MTINVVMGFDYGRRRVGVAVGQTVTGDARPLETLRCPDEGRPDWAGIERLLREWQPDMVVVGRPSHADGSDSPITVAAERFARQLQGRFGIAVQMVDERLSSVEAEARLAAAEGKRARHAKEAVDMMAASIILETWLSDYHP
ncbi:MAG: Holliday junction resolvase RuvX [Aquisalimonadaceae bacterium]